MIDLQAKEKLTRPVTLDEIKKSAALKNFDLVRLPRLSVMPVTEAQWKILLGMAAAAFWIRWDHNRRGHYFWEHAHPVQAGK